MKLLSYETALSFKAKLCFNAVAKPEDHAKAETNNSSSEVKKKPVHSRISYDNHLKIAVFNIWMIAKLLQRTPSRYSTFTSVELHSHRNVIVPFGG